MSFLNKKSILITGGTGSFGKKIVDTILKKYPDVYRLIVYSRDELKQYEMNNVYPVTKYGCMRYFIGDVRDFNRLKLATQGVDIIIHAAALKHVPIAEENPMECIKTNVMGAQNVIDSALENNINCVVALSSDKAVSPINLYGASKLCSDKLFIAANNLKGWRNIRFSVVRYGNVVGSRGSVIPFFLKARENGVLPITHKDMTRFNISLEDAVEMVLFAIENSIGGEIFVPKLPSYKILDVAEAIAPSCEIKYVGIRPGEKLHEEMITKNDSYNTIDIGKYYVILPTIRCNKDNYINYYNGTPVEPGFFYSSDSNKDWLNVEDIKEQIRNHVDENFKPQ